MASFGLSLLSTEPGRDGVVCDMGRVQRRPDRQEPDIERSRLVAVSKKHMGCSSISTWRSVL